MQLVGDLGNNKMPENVTGRHEEKIVTRKHGQEKSTQVGNWFLNHCFKSSLQLSFRYGLKLQWHIDLQKT